jgi:hypothetical protein
MADLPRAERDAYAARMRENVQKNNPSAVLPEEQLAAFSMINLVDTIPLITNKPKLGYVGVNLYVDDQGEAKQLPYNPRATAICQAIGRPTMVRGDAFISRFFDNDDDFRRLDFRRAELADAETEFFKTATVEAQSSGEDRQANQDFMRHLANATDGAKPASSLPGSLVAGSARLCVLCISSRHCSMFLLRNV